LATAKAAPLTVRTKTRYPTKIEVASNAVTRFDLV